MKLDQLINDTIKSIVYGCVYTDEDDSRTMLKIPDGIEFNILLDAAGNICLANTPSACTVNFTVRF